MLEAESADITHTLKHVHTANIIDHENEDPSFFKEFTRVIDDAALQHADDDPTGDVAPTTEVDTDLYVGMELALPRGDKGQMLFARMTKRMKDNEGIPVRTAKSNPLLDFRQYDVKFVDGNVEELTANIIAENLIAQIDEEGHRQIMLDEIVDHRTTRDAIPKT